MTVKDTNTRSATVPQPPPVTEPSGKAVAGPIVNPDSKALWAAVCLAQRRLENARAAVPAREQELAAAKKALSQYLDGK